MRQTLLLVSCGALGCATAWAGPDCTARLQSAHRAEVQLVLAERRRLCPEQEQLAEQLQAGSDGLTGVAQLNFAAYSRCRQQAELALQRRRPVLYRNPFGLPYYTLEGARLAREAWLVSPAAGGCAALSPGASGSNPQR
jgi:hypothetical protein